MSRKITIAGHIILSLDLEYRRFASDSWVDYQKMQIDIIKKYTDKPVTHNFMGHFSDLDYYDLAKDLDFVAWDNIRTISGEIPNMNMFPWHMKICMD